MATTNIKRQKELPIEELKRIFYYDFNTETLRWKIRTKKTLPGSPAGAANKSGHMMVSYNNEKFYVHRVVFALFNNRWPNGIIDHIDRNRGNNNPNNLREADDNQNNYNMKMRIDNSSGVRGVSKHCGGWHAEVQAKGIRYRKWFKSKEKAIKWAIETRKQVFGEFFNG